MTPQLSPPRSGSKHQALGTGTDASATRKVTLYVRDPELWARARRVSGRGGLSEWVQACLRQCLEAHSRTAPPSLVERARRLEHDARALVRSIETAQTTDRVPRPRSRRPRARVP